MRFIVSFGAGLGCAFLVFAVWTFFAPTEDPAPLVRPLPQQGEGLLPRSAERPAALPLNENLYREDGSLNLEGALRAKGRTPPPPPPAETPDGEPEGTKPEAPDPSADEPR